MHGARRQPRLLLKRAAIEIDAAELAAAVRVGVEGLDGAIDLLEEAPEPQLGVFTRVDGHGERGEIDVLALAQQRRPPGPVSNHLATPPSRQEAGNMREHRSVRRTPLCSFPNPERRS